MVTTGRITDEYYRMMAKLGIAEPRPDLVEINSKNYKKLENSKTKKSKINLNEIILASDFLEDETYENAENPISAEEYTDTEEIYGSMIEQNVVDYTLAELS